MEIIWYDGTFEGWLSAVFEVYERKLSDVKISPPDRVATTSLFGPGITVTTNEAKARRVWKGICTKISINAAKKIYCSFLSEEQGMEDHLLRYVRYALSSKLSIEHDYAHPAVRYVIDTEKKVRREKHRMEAFVRFALTVDGIYYAAVDPDFNVLPLIRQHFERRYADQRWLIYDAHRKYGIYYDLSETLPVTIQPANPSEPSATIADSATLPNPLAPADPATTPLSVFTPDETQYQELWRHYFQKVNIPARKNLQLHLRHMPVRYWKYLPEKRPAFPR